MCAKVSYNGSSKKIHNDYKYLDKFRERLDSTASELNKTKDAMQKRITDLNEKGFSDANFESLYNAFMGNVGNLGKIENALHDFSAHIDGLSKLIKAYYKVEI